MKKIRIGESDVFASQIALGCMRMDKLSVDEAAEVIKAALDSGINFFDHADIYGQGKSEKIFAEALKQLAVPREDIFIQSKCGIDAKNACYNFSKDYILEAVDGILERLQSDYLDFLVLHRPDSWMDPTEVNEAFKILKETGKVKHFGVSNHSENQIKFLETEVQEKLELNQLQLSLMHADLFKSGFHVNLSYDVMSEGLLEYLRKEKMTIQAWSPFYAGFFKEVFIDHKDYPVLNRKLAQFAQRYNVSKEAIAIAWLTSHPAEIQVLSGSMNPERIKKIAAGADIRLSREEWYDLYRAAGHLLP